MVRQYNLKMARRRRTLFSRVMSWFIWYAVISRCAVVAAAEDDDHDDDDDHDNDDDFSHCKGHIDFIKDGICDFPNNNVACEYDGGDCCECTCQENLENECGEHGNGYVCLDPEADCLVATPTPTWSSFAPTASPTGVRFPDCPEIGIVQFIGDGRCDDHNNHPECGYDGGDCCPCTCGDSFACGVNGYLCIDPDVPFDCHETDSPTPAPYGTSSASSGSGSYPTYPRGPIDYTQCTGYTEYIGDGDCDDYNNNEACGYDGGDCCECSCIPGLFDCGIAGYDCADPEYIVECPTRPTPAPLVPVVAEPEVETPRSALQKMRDFNNIGRTLVVFVFVCIVVCSIGGIAVFTARERQARRAAGIIDASSNAPKIAPIGDDYDDIDPKKHGEAERNGEAKTESGSESPATDPL